MKSNIFFVLFGISIFILSCNQNSEDKSEELETKEKELEERENSIREKEAELLGNQTNSLENNNENTYSLPPTRTLPQTKEIPSFDQLLDIYLTIGTNGNASRVNRLGFEISNNLGYVQVFEDEDGNYLVVNISSKRVSLSSNYNIDKYENDIKKEGFILASEASQKNIYGISTFEKYINLDTQITIRKLEDGQYRNGITIERYYSKN